MAEDTHRTHRHGDALRPSTEAQERHTLPEVVLGHPGHRDKATGQPEPPQDAQSGTWSEMRRSSTLI